jgi:4-nitrophenyl phosphatase
LRHLFVTNRANRTPDQICTQLNGYGIHCTTDNVLTSAQATVQYLKTGSVYLIGEQGLQQEVEKAGMVITEDSPDYVVVSFDRGLTYDKIKKACRFIDGGARFIATNPDKGLRTENGISPGTGAIVAAVAAGCGVEPLIIGKPEKFIIETAVERLDLNKDEVIMVGDNIDIDIPAGNKAGVRTVLILTGITRPEEVEASSLHPDWIVNDYTELQSIVTSLLS